MARGRREEYWRPYVKSKSRGTILFLGGARVFQERLNVRGGPGAQNLQGVVVFARDERARAKEGGNPHPP